MQLKVTGINFNPRTGTLKFTLDGGEVEITAAYNADFAFHEGVTSGTLALVALTQQEQIRDLARRVEALEAGQRE